MATVDITTSSSGSIALSGNDALFYVVDGRVEFSTDGETTYIPFNQGDRVVFSDGLTVHYRKANPQSATFSHMPI